MRLHEECTGIIKRWDLPTAVMRPLTTARVKCCVGHSGRVDHSFVSELYGSTRLLLLGLKYAMLPHTLDEALLSIHGADLHVSNSGLVCLSALMASSFCNFCCLKCWFSSCNFWIIFSPGTACMCSYLFTSFQLLVQLLKLFLPGFNNVIFLLSYLLYFLLSSSDCCIVISDCYQEDIVAREVTMYDTIRVEVGEGQGYVVAKVH